MEWTSWDYIIAPRQHNVSADKMGYSAFGFSVYSSIPSLFPSVPWGFHRVIVSRKMCLLSLAWNLFYQVAHSICDGNMEKNITPCLSWGIITKLGLRRKTDQNAGKNWGTAHCNSTNRFFTLKSETHMTWDLSEKNYKTGYILQTKAKTKTNQKKPKCFNSLGW